MMQYRQPGVMAAADLPAGWETMTEDERYPYRPRTILAEPLLFPDEHYCQACGNPTRWQPQAEGTLICGRCHYRQVEDRPAEDSHF